MKTQQQTSYELVKALTLIQSIKDALGTAEDGEALVEVARNAHKAEMELAARLRKEQEEQDELQSINTEMLNDL